MNQNNYDLNKLRSRFQFFLANAGFRVGYRAAGALSLAKAEAMLKRAQRYGVAQIRWEDDTCPDLSWLEQPEFKGYEVREVLGCVLEIRCPECGGWIHAASVWGICDPDTAYLFEVEAELALESASELARVLELVA